MKHLIIMTKKEVQFVIFAGNFAWDVAWHHGPLRNLHATIHSLASSILGFGVVE